jgi:hypothetical protein
MSLNTRLNNIEKFLSKKPDLKKLYYPIYPENRGVCVEKDGFPPCIYEGLSITEEIPTQEKLVKYS